MRTILILLLLGASLAGCIGQVDEPIEENEADPLDDPLPQHRPASIKWGPVETEFNVGFPPGWKAVQTARITNTLDGARAISASLQSDRGDIEVASLRDAPEADTPAGDDEPAYVFLATRIGYGPTEGQAITAMEAVKLTHADEIHDGTLHIETLLEVPDDTGDAGPVSTGLFGIHHDAHLAAFLLDEIALDVAVSTGSGDIEVDRLEPVALALETGSGDIDVTEIDAITATLSTGSGDIDLSDARVRTLAAETGSGDVDLDGSFDQLVADTGSGDIDATARPLASGGYVLGTGSGTIDLTLDGTDGNGYDVQASTGSGDIEIDIPDGEHVRGSADEGHLHVRTNGYTSKAIRTGIATATGSGDISVEA